MRFRPRPVGKQCTTGLKIHTNTQTINVTVTDSVIASNAIAGIVAVSKGGTSVNVMVRNSIIAGNSHHGLDAIAYWCHRSRHSINDCGKWL